jgi:hypothetical protein
VGVYDQQRTSSPGSASAHEAALGPQVGRSTLVQQLAQDDHRSPPMFAAAPQWETIDPAEIAEPPLPPLAASARSAAAPAAEPASVPSTPTSDAVSVASDAEPSDAQPAASAARATAAAHDPLHIAGQTNAHAGPFERKHKDGDHHAAHVDAYNRGTVHSDHAAAHVFGRPGVVSHGHGLFQLKKDTVRYTYTAHGHANIAVPFDMIHKDKLLSINSKAPHLNAHDKAKLKKEGHDGKTMRLALNPAMPRQLTIDDQETWCVLSWIDGEGGGAAWLPVKNLVGNTSQIRHDVARRAAHEGPSTKLSPSTPYLIRDDAVGQADAQDLKRDKHGTPHGRVLSSGAKSGDNVSHYLEKGIRKPEFSGSTPTGHTVERGFVALCMNLPEGKTPPVATDTMLAGETFFAFNDKKFHREVAVYENGAHVSHRRQTWVFGHVGKQHGGTGPEAAAMAPDPARAGWVPLRVLKVT